MDEKGYREAVIVDPGAEPLHPIFTRTVDELVKERQKLEMVPDFWLEYTKKYTFSKSRRLTPDPTAALVVLIMHAFGGFSAHLAIRDWHTSGYLILYALLILPVAPLLIVTDSAYRDIHKGDQRGFWWGLSLYAMYAFPLIGAWHGGKEALAAFIRWRRLKAPRSVQETRDRFFGATRTELIDTLRGRLEPVANGLDASDPRWSLIATAEAYVRACERSFEDWMETEQPRPFSHGCAGKGNVHLYASNGDAREALQRAYLLARQAVDDAERGPTYVSVDTAVALPGAHDNSPLAFAKTLVPRRYHAK